MKKIILTCLLLIVSIFLVNYVSAEILVSESGVEYDSDISNAFSNKEFAQEKSFHNATNYSTLEVINDEVWLKVIVRLKDNSNIDITGTKEEKVDLIKQKEEWFEPRINNVLDTLSEDDVKEVRRHSDGFGALLSEEGFDKLINNEDVRKIIWPQTGAIGLQGNSLSKSLVWSIIIIFLIIIIFHFVIRKLRNNKK